MRFFVLLLLCFSFACNNNLGKVRMEEALQIVCEKGKSVMALGLSNKDKKEAKRREYIRGKNTRDTILKMKDGSSIIISDIMPEDMEKRCFTRYYPKIIVPNSMGYKK